MYDYISLRVDADPCNEDITDLLAAFLAEGEFETFEPDDKGLTAYIRKDKYDDSFVKKVITDFPIPTTLKYSKEEIKGEDWNAEWEQNYFRPISIDDRVVIRSTFHKEFPDAPIEIIIDPKMAFGTGHHATTAGMCRMLLEEDLTGKSVIDMGTGTGILSILSKKLGSGPTVGIDIDEFAVENARENGQLNGVKVEWLIGDDKALEDLEPADIFLANINLNVILENLGNYIDKMKRRGRIFLSGFLKGDREKIMEEALKRGLKFLKEGEENGWMVMVFEKG